MANRVHRSISEPIRSDPSFEERWKGSDQGLITCWEVGRKLAKTEPALAERTRRGELPVLGWKGGVEKKLKARKYGTLNYLAQWQGLRGEDLDVDLAEDRELTCARTGMLVTYTADQAKWG